MERRFFYDIHRCLLTSAQVLSDIDLPERPTHFPVLKESIPSAHAEVVALPQLEPAERVAAALASLPGAPLSV